MRRLTFSHHYLSIKYCEDSIHVLLILVAGLVVLLNEKANEC